MPTPRHAARLISRQDELDACGAIIEQQDELPLDTEFARTDTFRPKLCLIQVATPGEMFCIDMLADLDSSRLWTSLASARHLTILHAAKQDLEVLMLRFGALPARLFDTQIAAGLLGHPPQTGYAALVQAELGVRLEKTQTRTDWTRRPLTAAQIAYAADDVAYLEELGRRLRQRLAGSGREAWALEDSAALLDTDLYRVHPESAWERLSGLEYQSVPVQARARGLAAWREERADRADRPRQWILSDQAIMALAAAGPGDLAAIEALNVMPPGVVRNSGEAILAVLREADAGLAAGRAALTQLARPAPLDNGNLRRLAAVVQKAAAELGIAPEILATRSEMTALLRGSRDLRPLQGWRRAVIGEALLAAL
jgi:ribonuclease D